MVLENLDHPFHSSGHRDRNRSSFSGHLDQHADRVTAAEAEAADALLAAGSGELMKEGDQHSSATRADGVAECHAAAADVHLVFGDAEVFDVGEHLGREGFVHFEEIDVGLR